MSSCVAAHAGAPDAKRRHHEASAMPMIRSDVVAGNDLTSSDEDDDRLSPASSPYFVTSGAEEEPGTGFQQTQLIDSDRQLQVERQSTQDTSHQHDDDQTDRSSSLLAAEPLTPSSTGSGNRPNMTGKSVSVGSEEKSFKASTMMATSKIGEAMASSRSDLELLCRLFPQVQPVTLDCMLLSCAGNVVQCIEQLLKFYQLKPSVDIPTLPVGANFGAAAAAAYGGLPPHALPTYHHHHRFVSSSSLDPLAFAMPVGAGGSANAGGLTKPASAAALSLMPSTQFNNADAMRQLCSPAGNNVGGPRVLPFGFPYPPAAAAAAAALLPTIAGLRYNYSAMMAAAAMAHASSASTCSSAGPLPKATLSGGAGATPLPLLFASGGYKCPGPPTDSDK